MSEELSTALAGQLERAVADFFEALERGETPDRAALLAEHSAVAAELAEFFADHDRLARFVGAAAEATASHPRRVGKGDSADTLTPPSSYLPPTWTLAPGAAERVAAMSSSLLPRQLGPYELVAELGRGGMGIVYQARHVELNRMVALKTILAGRFAAPVERQRFAAEARLAANLDHAGIVPIYEVSEADGTPYLAMQLVAGDSLAQRLHGGPLPPQAAARLLRKIAAAVAYAHAQGIIHRDLKPGNILLASASKSSAGQQSATGWDDCEPRITDFGLAKRLDGGAQLTASGEILGTPSYMPPEQAAGRPGEVGPAADVYSLGAILYAMLTGRAPFQAESAVDVILQVLEREPILPRQLQPAVPRELEWICLKCLEKNPASRYASADELVADLDRFLRHEPPEARRLTAGRWVRRWVRLQPVLAGHVIALATTLLIAQVVFAVHPGREIFYHFRMSGVLLAWLAACILFQWLLARERTSCWPLYLWSGADAAFFTAVLLQSATAVGILVAGYGLLVCVSGLGGRARLVTFTTASGLAAYLALLVLRPQEFEPVRCAFLGLTIVLTGLAVGYQVWRMRVLREYYGDRQV